jgi:hypothetical protein
MNNGICLVTMKRIAICANNGTPKYLLDVIEDITERKEAEPKIAYMASHYALTDLPNRTAFEKYLTLTVESAAGVASAICSPVYGSGSIQRGQ